MASNVPTSSNAANPSNAVSPTNGTSPWTTTELLVLTQCWITVYKVLPVVAPLNCLVGDECSHFIALFNYQVGKGQGRVKLDTISKWMELKEKVTWFNRCYNREKCDALKRMINNFLKT